MQAQTQLHKCQTLYFPFAPPCLSLHSRCSPPGVCPRLVSLIDFSTPEAILMDTMWAVRSHVCSATFKMQRKMIQEMFFLYCRDALAQVTNLSAGSSRHTSTLMQCGGIAAAAASTSSCAFICFDASDCIFAAIPRLVAMMMPPAALPIREQAAWGVH